MDKNTILGLVLMVVVVLLFSWWMQPTPEQLEAQRRYNDSIAAVEAERMAEALCRRFGRIYYFVQ